MYTPLHVYTKKAFRAHDSNRAVQVEIFLWMRRRIDLLPSAAQTRNDKCVRDETFLSIFVRVFSLFPNSFATE